MRSGRLRRNSCTNISDNRNISSLLLILVTIISSTQNHVVESAVVSLSDLTDIFEFTKEVVQTVLKTWDVVGPAVTENKLLPPVLKSKEKKIMSKIMTLNDAISRVERRVVSSSISVMNNLQQDLPKVLRMELKLDDLLMKTSKIEAADQYFQDYLAAGVNSSSYNETEGLHFERLTLENFAQYTVSQYPDSILGQMEQIHYLLAPESWQQKLLTNEGGVLIQIRNALQEAESNLCNVQQSPQQVIYNIYTSLQMTQLKGYTMMQFSWMLLRLYNKGNFTLEANRAREKYLKRIKLQTQAAKIAMKTAHQAMWRCDPYKQVKDETYTELIGLLQGYLQNEVDLNNDESCTENCGYYGYTKQYGCFKNKFCSQQKGCNGRIVECQFIDSDMRVCQDKKSSDIRYKWIRYKNGQTFGDTSQSCAAETQVDSWWRYLFWHCSYCFCICDDPHFSDRFFNLRPVTSDVDKNKVITAIRFIKNDHIIHIQIQEGIMLPKGMIDESSISWKAVEEYKMGITGTKDVDYHEMSYEERALDLDDLYAPPNFVLTGIKFRKVGGHLNMEILITPFNFTDGMLIKPHEKSEWISNDNTDGALASPRTEVKLNEPDVPIRYPKNNRPDSVHDQFITFTHTDMYKDVAQHTIPYIDTQIVGPYPPTPLSGAGIIHRGQSGSGGFIAPKVFTYNMGHHLQEDFEEVKEKSTRNPSYVSEI